MEFQGVLDTFLPYLRVFLVGLRCYSVIMGGFHPGDSGVMRYRGQPAFKPGTKVTLDVDSADAMGEASAARQMRVVSVRRGERVTLVLRGAQHAGRPIHITASTRRMYLGPLAVRCP